MCTEKVTKVIGGREIENNVLFLDEDTMIPFHSFTLDQYEDSLSCATMKLSLGDIHTADTAATGLNTIEEYVVIGTCYIVPNEQEPSQGRLLVFQVETNSEGGRIVTLVAEKDTKGPVYSLAEMNTKLVAGVNHKVQVFNLVRGEAIQSSSGTSVTAPVSELVLECAVAGQLMCLYLKTDCDKILVGDLLRSMTLLQYKPPIATTSTTATTTTTIGNSGSVPSNQRESKINGTLVEVCRHYSTDSLRSVEILKDTAENIYLGADSDGNLYTTRQVMDAPTEEEKGKMEPHGYFNLGDIVNVIKQGSLTGQLFETSSSSSGVAEMASSYTKADIICTTSNPDDLMKIDSMNNESSVLVATNRTVNSNVLIGSVTGGLYSVVGIDHDAFTFFHAVEKAVTYLTVGIGGFSHEDFRSFCNDRRSQAQRGFIDGDLVERVLDLSPTDVEAITRRVNDDLTGLVSATATASVDTGTAVGGGVVYSVDDFLRKIEDIARQH